MENRTIITDEILDEERSLYGLKNAMVKNCAFEGPADGESALKEAKNIAVENCRFKLRYPLWHVNGFTLCDSNMNETTRAALWYSFNGEIKNSVLGGIKALRECGDISIEDCGINSAEFGWKCRNITVKNSSLTSEYLFLDSSDISLENVNMSGKYSFQYVDGLTIKNCDFNTKDAFWHSKNVTVENSVIKGEYLAWFSENLTLVNCKIIGTQPFCYCENLRLINCTMDEINGHIDSVKNPRSGFITADSVGEIIRGDEVMECTGKVVIRPSDS